MNFLVRFVRKGILSTHYEKTIFEMKMEMSPYYEIVQFLGLDPQTKARLMNT